MRTNNDCSNISLGPVNQAISHVLSLQLRHASQAGCEPETTTAVRPREGSDQRMNRRRAIKKMHPQSKAICINRATNLALAMSFVICPPLLKGNNNTLVSNNELTGKALSITMPSCHCCKCL